MKKAEAISILATSVRPREAKDRARYDEAVKMAIEALKSSEIPNNSERTAETAQADHVADIGKKVSISCGQENDAISRKAAIDRINKQREHLQPDICPQDKIGDATYRICAEFIARLHPHPEIVRCKDCKHYLHDEEYGFDWCNRMSGVFRAKPDGFCSWAVMRGGGSE